MTATHITVSGLKGGRSGVEIHVGRGNAIKILARTLREIGGVCVFRMAHLEGGSKRNAIPREAEATIYVGKSDVDSVVKLVEKVSLAVRAEYASVNSEVVVEASPAESSDRVPGMAEQEQIIGFLHTVPRGLIAMTMISGTDF